MQQRITCGGYVPSRVVLRLHCTVASYRYVTATGPEEQETHVQELRCLIPISSLAAGASEGPVCVLFHLFPSHAVVFLKFPHTKQWLN
jgi:hypothetical protein